HLVAVAPDFVRGDDWLELEAVEPAEAVERALEQFLLARELRLVGHCLPRRSGAALAHVIAAHRNAVGTRLEQLDHAALREGSLGLRHLRLHEVARKAALDEDDEAVRPRDARSAVGDALDPQLEQL